MVAGLGLVYRLARGRRASSPKPRRLLVIRLDLLGDVLFSVGAVRALRARYPEARITMLTLPYTAPLARLYPQVDEVIEVDTNRIRTIRGLLDPGTWIDYFRSVQCLRRGRFDVALSLSGPMASLWAFLSGATRTVGYEGEGYPFMLTDPIPGRRYGERKPEVEYVAAMAAAAGAESVDSRLQVPVPSHAIAATEKLLAHAGIATDEPLVVVHAGSVNGSAKRWPPGHWARFIDAVREQTAARVVLVGAATDASIAEEVTQRAQSEVDSVVGQTTVEELIALIARADLVATGDSGPLHLAVALRRPIVAVYGPTDPSIHGPYRPTAPAIIHRADLPCSPCYTMAASAECPLGDPVCMRLVSVDRMVRSAVRLLSQTGNSARSEH